MSAVGLPEDLLCYFQARPPLPYIPNIKTKPHRKYEGIADLIQSVESIFDKGLPPIITPFDSPREKREKLRAMKLATYNGELQIKIRGYDPRNTFSDMTDDPYNTLFVGRLSYDTTERTLRKEFETYGPIKKICLITDLNGQSKGYAFIEYESESSLKEAYRYSNKVIDGRKVIVDVERGRTVENWLPRRLGGGKGPPRGSETWTKSKKSSISGQSNQLYCTPYKNSDSYLREQRPHGKYGNRYKINSRPGRSDRQKYYDQYQHSYNNRGHFRGHSTRDRYPRGSSSYRQNAVPY
ncbi:RNA recognition motif family protein [Cryptosporidium serpentis]